MYNEGNRLELVHVEMRTENFIKTAISAKLLGIYPHVCVNTW